MKPWEIFYNRQLNQPKVAQLIDERERQRALERKQLQDALLEAAATPIYTQPQWSDCDPEPLVNDAGRVAILKEIKQVVGDLNNFQDVMLHKRKPGGES